MTHFMAYVALVSAGIAAVATVVELVVRPRTSRGRWIWVSALSAIIVATVFVAFRPASRVEATVGAASRPLSIGGVSASPITVEVRLPQREPGVLQIADDFLQALWLVSSLVLLAAILLGQRRLSLERASAKRTQVNGREVLLTEDVGPAVAGAGNPVVLLPRWVLALDAPSQQLLLDHEFEHVREGDTRLLLAGAVATALMPWNPVLWWVTQRLRLAVEQDCDARVLRRHPDVRRYTDLLLMAASQPRVSARLLAAHFGEHRSDLGRRIQAMTERKTKWDRTLAMFSVAAVLVAVSCEAPRPGPLAPGNSDGAPPQAISATDVLHEFQVEKSAKLVSGAPMPRYPEILRQAGVEGEVLASFVVDERGNADTASFKVIRATHELFATAVRQMLPGMRFVPAEVGGKKVKQLVQQPFTFTLPGASSSTETQLDVSTANGKRLAFTVKRSELPIAIIADSHSTVSATARKRLAFTVKRNERPAEAWEQKAESNALQTPEVVSQRANSLLPNQGYDKIVLYNMRVSDDTGPLPPNVIVYNSRGVEIARFAGGRRISSITLGGVESIVEQTSGHCAPLMCPATRITLKPGYQLIDYRDWKR